MRDGFVLVGAASPMIQVGNPAYNVKEHIAIAQEAGRAGVKVLVFSELSLSGYTAGDLFHQELLLAGCESALDEYRKATKDLDMIAFVGIPHRVKGKLYNCAAAVSHGKILGLIPKTHLPNYREFYDVRYFTPATGETTTALLCGEEVPFGTKLLFTCTSMPSLTVGCEICEDLWVNIPPSCYHAEAGATLIVNLSASDELIGKDEHRRNLVTLHSERSRTVYLYAAASEGESGADMVFSGHCLIAECGRLVAEKEAFRKEGLLYGEVDLDRVISERAKANTCYAEAKGEYTEIPFELAVADTPILYPMAKNAFFPDDKEGGDNACGVVRNIQTTALALRLQRSHSRGSVLGVSGGLDSTLALLACCDAADKLGWDRSTVTGVVMPCFGTTKRTRTNGEALICELGATLRVVDIQNSVLSHFRDIGHDPGNFNAVYENGQARERTQVLMDIANGENALVVGTGDMSELALGWATYNGDHMSMYGINTGVPKTLVKRMVEYHRDMAKQGGKDTLAKILTDILDTPVSPELLPPENGEISQCTEGIVGPYALHDYFLYYFVRFGFRPNKILRMATASFQGVYDRDTIRLWLRVFVKRFFTQQFKRSCLPEGPKVCSVSLSPRGDWRMGGDIDPAIWLETI